MKRELLIKLLEKMPEGAEVKMHSATGESVLFVNAYENDNNTIWLECESDIDLSAELDARFTNAAETQMDELDFYMDLVERGITPEMVERNRSKMDADIMREFCEDHALY